MRCSVVALLVFLSCSNLAASFPGGRSKQVSIDLNLDSKNSDDNGFYVNAALIKKIIELKVWFLEALRSALDASHDLEITIGKSPKTRREGGDVSVTIGGQKDDRRRRPPTWSERDSEPDRIRLNIGQSKGPEETVKLNIYSEERRRNSEGWRREPFWK